MILRHYSSTPFRLDPTRVYEPGPHNFKPSGLWLSVVGKDDWQHWCEGEQFDLDGLANHADFEVNWANILLVEDLYALRTFTQKYYSIPSPYQKIDWRRVMREYDGIVIAPYQWKACLDPWTFWYRSWDCASGCVWNLCALKVE